MTRPFRHRWEATFRSAGIAKGNGGASVIAVGLTLATYANTGDGGSIHPGAKRLSEELGMSRSTVERAMQRLQSEGWLTKVREANHRRGQADEYRLSLPADRISSEADRMSSETDRMSLVQRSHVTGAAPQAQAPAQVHQHIYTGSPAAAEGTVEDIWADPVEDDVWAAAEAQLAAKAKVSAERAALLASAPPFD